MLKTFFKKLMLNICKIGRYIRY